MKTDPNKERMIYIKDKLISIIRGREKAETEMIELFTSKPDFFVLGLQRINFEALSENFYKEFLGEVSGPIRRELGVRKDNNKILTFPKNYEHFGHMYRVAISCCEYAIAMYSYKSLKVSYDKV